MRCPVMGRATTTTADGIFAAHHVVCGGCGLMTIGGALASDAGMAAIGPKSMCPAIVKLLTVAGDCPWSGSGGQCARGGTYRSSGSSSMWR